MNANLIIASVIGAIAVTTIGAVASYRVLASKTYAEVLSVNPASVTVSVPREACRDELVSTKHATQDPNKIVGTVAGAVVGGLIGTQIGGGSGKKVATVGGAVAGGVAGNKIQDGMQERNIDQQMQRICTTVQDTHEEPAGFDVTYRLDGSQHRVRTTYDPGVRIEIADGSAVLSK